MSSSSLPVAVSVNMSGATLLAFQDISTEKWEFYEESQLYSFPGATNDDSAEFSCYDKSCFFKSSEG